MPPRPLTTPARAPRRSCRLVLLLLTLPACGGSSGVHPVTGKVTHKGVPCKGAVVVFHPVADNSLEAKKPNAVVGDDGTFRLTTNPSRPGDGAPAGEYVVTVTWPAPRPAGPVKGMGGAEEKRPEIDQLRGRYSNEKTSPLRRTVKTGNNELEPIALD